MGSYATGARPIKRPGNLTSIQRNHNNLWDKEARSQMIKKSQILTKASYVDVHACFRFIKWLVILATIILTSDINNCMCGCHISKRIRFTCFHAFVSLQSRKNTSKTLHAIFIWSVQWEPLTLFLTQNRSFNGNICLPYWCLSTIHHWILNLPGDIQIEILTCCLNFQR